ncbi:MAG: hypothetical protein ABH851_08825 [Methanobacteriota archaeon]
MKPDDIRGIKTDYVRGKIKGMLLTPKIEEYVEDLIALEKAVLSGSTDWNIARRCEGVKKDFLVEYLEILKELNPEKYGDEIFRLSEDKKVKVDFSHKHVEEEKRRIGELRRLWEEMGGKV